MPNITIGEAATRLGIRESLLFTIIQGAGAEVVRTAEGRTISMEDFKALALVVGLTRPPGLPAEIFAGGIS